MTNKKQGNLFIISAASGAGKTSLVKRILSENKNISLSISHTTRKARSSEIEGKDYFFVKDDEFNEMKNKGQFLETAICHGFSYGTSKNTIKEMQNLGKDIIFEIDWQGAKSIKTIFSEAIAIFILPPSIQKLEERLVARGQDSLDIIKARLSAAKSEMSHIDQFDYVTINEDFDDAVKDLNSIIRAEKLKTKLQQFNHQDLIKQLINP